MDSNNSVIKRLWGIIPSDFHFFVRITLLQHYSAYSDKYTLQERNIKCSIDIVYLYDKRIHF